MSEQDKRIKESKEKLFNSIDGIHKKMAQLQAENERLRGLINDTPDCPPECNSYGHDEKCMNCDPLAVLEAERDELKAENERLKEQLIESDCALATCDVKKYELQKVVDALLRWDNDPQAENSFRYVVDALERYKTAQQAKGGNRD